MYFKLSNSVIAFIFSSNIAAVVHGATTAGMLNSRYENKYHIVVYQNARCTGESIIYSGDSEGCYNGLGNGGSGVQLMALENGGKLVFYSQPGCPDNEKVEWEALRKTGMWMGLVPVNHQIEAMLVELRLIGRK